MATDVATKTPAGFWRQTSHGKGHRLHHSFFTNSPRDCIRRAMELQNSPKSISPLPSLSISPIIASSPSLGLFVKSASFLSFQKRGTTRQQCTVATGCFRLIPLTLHNEHLLPIRVRMIGSSPRSVEELVKNYCSYYIVDL